MTGFSTPELKAMLLKQELDGIKLLNIPARSEEENHKAA